MDLIHLSYESIQNQMKNQERVVFDSIIDSILFMTSNVMGFSKKSIIEEYFFAIS